MSALLQGVDPNAVTLDGLDSTAFAILAGRAGGQTLQGGTGASETLTLVSTAHGTKGGITLTGSHVILPGSIRPAADSTAALTLCKANGTAVVTVDTTNGRVGVSEGEPLGRLQVRGSDNNTNTLRLTTETYTQASAGSLLTIGHGATSGDTFATITNLNGGAAYYGDLVLQNGGGNVGIGVAAPATRLDIGAGAMTFLEMTAPGAGAANTARIYAVDNGGKTELVVQFATGSPIRLAIEV